MPLAIGYLSAQLAGEAEICRLCVVLDGLARGHGHWLQAVHVERLGTLPDAFQALVEQVDRERIRVVLMPSFHHLAPLGRPLLVEQHLEQLIGGDVVAAGYTLEPAGLTCRCL